MTVNSSAIGILEGIHARRDPASRTHSVNLFCWPLEALKI